jgi:signal transduction histidine kinase
MRPVKTNAETTAWARRYRTALRQFLRQGPRASASAAERLGVQAADFGLETLDVAGVHEQALITVAPPEEAVGNAGRKRREWADIFFKETIVPIEATHRAARMAESRIDRLTRTLRQRGAEASASNEQLEQAIAQREAAEAKTREREARQKELLAEAQRMQQRLRHRMRDILSEQEGERQQIGADLRDEIAQALVAIDISLLALNTSGRVNTDEIDKSIAEARRILKEWRSRGCLAGDRWGCI